MMMLSACVPRSRTAGVAAAAAACGRRLLSAGGGGGGDTPFKYNVKRLHPPPVTGTRTKVVCTIGPATDQRVDELVVEDMAVARLNFSHAGDDYSYPEECMAKVRESRLGKHCQLATGSTLDEAGQIKLPANLRGILVDTKGSF